MFEVWVLWREVWGIKKGRKKGREEGEEEGDGRERERNMGGGGIHFRRTFGFQSQPISSLDTKA